MKLGRLPAEDRADLARQARTNAATASLATQTRHSSKMIQSFHNNKSRKQRLSLRTLQNILFVAGIASWIGIQTIYSRRAVLITSQALTQQQPSSSLSFGHNSKGNNSHYHSKHSRAGRNSSAKEDNLQTLWKRALENQNQNQQQKDEDVKSVSNSSSDFFSACLIVKDDNHWLIEWIAYHYHVLPLRHLILVQDPSSFTSPKQVLHRWKDRIKIEVWSDNDFLPPWVIAKATGNATKGWVNRTTASGNSTKAHRNHSNALGNRTKVSTNHSQAFGNSTEQQSGKKGLGGLWLHLNRQKQFYGRCLRHVQQQNQNSWVILTDTDEFVRIHPVIHPLSEQVRSQAGHILPFLESKLKLSPWLEVLDNQNKSLCLLAPRIQVSSVESNSTDLLPKIPSSFSPKDFLTFRWLYHNGREMLAGKNIIKLHANDEALPKAAHSVHHILNQCPQNTPGGKSWLDTAMEATSDREKTNSDPPLLLQIQHYLGTLQQFTYRDDPRDAVVQRPLSWHSRGRFPQAGIHDTGTTAWLNGFVASEGLSAAQILLQNVGKVAEPRQVNQSLSHWHEAYNATLVQEHLRHMSERNNNGHEKPFAACLVTMDDNHWLIEWLAFHFHVLPLKRLIYVQDPLSRTDSKPIFDRWQGRMHIQQWNDTQFLPSHILHKYRMGNLTNYHLHRYRQKFFYSACMKELKRQNATWVMLTDTDEFVRPNSLHVTKNAKLPSLSKPGSISRFLQGQIRARRVVSGNDNSTRPCLHIPRLQIAAKEYNSTEQQAIDIPVVPRGWNQSHFLTLRWLYHNGKEIVVGDHNLDGKNFVDVSRIPFEDIPLQIKNVHHVLPDYCPAYSGGKRIADRDSWLILGHYLGSFEQYSFRNDPRDTIPGRPKRDLARWESLGQPATMVETLTTAWLWGFIQSVGEEEARLLLQNVGETQAFAQKLKGEKGQEEKGRQENV